MNWRRGLSCCRGIFISGEGVGWFWSVDISIDTAGVSPLARLQGSAYADYVDEDIGAPVRDQRLWRAPGGGFCRDDDRVDRSEGRPCCCASQAIHGLSRIPANACVGSLRDRYSPYYHMARMGASRHCFTSPCERRSSSPDQKTPDIKKAPAPCDVGAFYLKALRGPGRRTGTLMRVGHRLTNRSHRHKKTPEPFQARGSD